MQVGRWDSQVHLHAILKRVVCYTAFRRPSHSPLSRNILSRHLSFPFQEAQTEKRRTLRRNNYVLFPVSLMAPETSLLSATTSCFHAEAKQQQQGTLLWTRQWFIPL